MGQVQKRAQGVARVNTGTIGKSGLKQMQGRIDQEVNASLRGGRDIQLYREMADNEAVIGGVLYLIETWAKRAKWRVEPAVENDEEAAGWARFIEECLQDMSHTWEELMDEILSMMPFGWALFEEVYKYREGPSQADATLRSKYSDGRIGWRKIVKREQDTTERWVFDADGGIQAMVQRDPVSYDTVEIPIEKSLLFRTKSTSNNPQGRSMLRSAVRSYIYLKRIQAIEATGIERDLSGYPVMEAPIELFDENDSQILNEMRKIVTSVRRDELEGAVIPCEVDNDGKPTGFKFRLMSSGGGRAINIDQVVRRYEQRIAMTVLCEFLLLGTDNVGSFSMHASKTNVFAVALTALLDRIGAIFNRFAIPRLLNFNGCPPEYFPKLVHGDLAPPPLDQIVAYVSGLSSAGMIMYDRRLERKLRELADLPEPEEPMLGEGDGEGLSPQMLAALPADLQEKLTGTAANAQPTEVPLTEDTVSLAQVSLNGAQISSILDTINAVAVGNLPRDSAVAIITTAFPISHAQAEAMMGSVGRGFKPSGVET